MSEINIKRKEILIEKKSRLLKELKELNKNITNIMEEEYEEQKKLILDNIDLLLMFVNSHKTKKCSDENPHNQTCLRCALLNAKNTGKWDHTKYAIKFELELRSKPNKRRKENTESIVLDETTQKNNKKPILPEQKLSPNQIKAKKPNTAANKKIKKLNRVLKVDEAAADLPEEWGR